MGTKLITNRNITVTGKSGSSVKFVKGVPVHVPDQAIEECMAAGAIPADGEVVEAHKPNPDVVDAPTGVERKQRILDAVDTMVVLNERGTFNANGAPKQAQLEKIAGFTIDTREIETLWHKYDAARKQDTIVDVDAIETVKTSAPVITEGEASESTEETESLTGGDVNNETSEMEKEKDGEESVGAATAEAPENPVESSEAAPAVASRDDMMDALKAAEVKFPGNISNIKLKELYDALPNEG